MVLPTRDVCSYAQKLIKTDPDDVFSSPPPFPVHAAYVPAGVIKTETNTYEDTSVSVPFMHNNIHHHAMPPLLCPIKQECSPSIDSDSVFNFPDPLSNNNNHEEMPPLLSPIKQESPQSIDDGSVFKYPPIPKRKRGAPKDTLGSLILKSLLQEKTEEAAAMPPRPARTVATVRAAAKAAAKAAAEKRSQSAKKAAATRRRRSM